jgi:hypothetical protein
MAAREVLEGDGARCCTGLDPVQAIAEILGQQVVKRLRCTGPIVEEGIVPFDDKLGAEAGDGLTRAEQHLALEAFDVDLDQIDPLCPSGSPSPAPCAHLKPKTIPIGVSFHRACIAARQ